MFYIVPYSERLDLDRHMACNGLEAAMHYAARMKSKTGRNYSVIKMESVWTTQTLGDLLAEDRAAVARGPHLRVTVTTDPYPGKE